MIFDDFKILSPLLLFDAPVWLLLFEWECCLTTETELTCCEVSAVVGIDDALLTDVADSLLTWCCSYEDCYYMF